MTTTKRPPIVTVLGHVDHGKTSLLDAIRKSSVATREAGGITQSIGASVIETPDKKIITFIDTPGHAAFSKMRARGANLADIVILVVAAEDGVKPQTQESLQVIKEAKIPFIVAITKVDLPSANPEMAKTQLEKEGVAFEGRGGETPAVLVSSKKGTGIDELLQTIILLSEVNEVNGSASSPLEAVVIETGKDKSGPVASLVVRDGTLSVGDTISTDTVSAKVRGIFDANKKSVKEVGPGYPAQILGFAALPEVGSKIVSGDMVAEAPQSQKVTKSSGGSVSIYLKTDSAGSLEALEAALPAGVNVIGSGVGDVNGSDIFLAKTSNAWVFVFEAKVPTSVKKLADTEGVRVESFAIIYELLQRLEEILKKGQVEFLGKAQILAIFPFNNRKVAGCKVLEGKIHKANTIIITRLGKELGKTKIASMKKAKQEITEAASGEEFGAILDTGLDFQVGDVILATK